MLVRNVAREEWRALARVVSLGDLAALEGVARQVSPLRAWKPPKSVGARWKKLPSTQRDVVQRLLAGPSIREIARDLGVTPRTVRGRAEAARKRLAGEAGAAPTRVVPRQADPAVLASLPAIWARAHALDSQCRSYAEIGRELGLSTQAARSLVRRVRRFLAAGTPASASGTAQEDAGAGNPRRRTGDPPPPVMHKTCVGLRIPVVLQTYRPRTTALAHCPAPLATALP
ncbi:RNA polymerase sigma factor [Nitrospira sp. BLG_2]|uniref:RNA polymerase sigma factor n=1 Tax=Nitrospira sp. BLG_2 TaxID=3397507 RepID=UPI003B9A9940